MIVSLKAEHIPAICALLNIFTHLVKYKLSSNSTVTEQRALKMCMFKIIHKLASLSICKIVDFQMGFFVVRIHDYDTASEVNVTNGKMRSESI